MSVSPGMNEDGKKYPNLSLGDESLPILSTSEANKQAMEALWTVEHIHDDGPHVAGGQYYPSVDNYFDSNDEKAFDATPDSGIHDLSSIDPEQRAKLEEDWRNELTKTEEEINTLRQVLSDKVKKAQDLKLKLGITPWKELRNDMEQSLRNIQETPAFPGIFSSTAYQRTSQTLKTAGEKTTSVLGTLGASMTKKLGEVKNSTAFRSFEEKMGTAYTNVKSRMNSSRSTSLYSFEEALNSSERRSTGFSSAAATPTIPEKSPIP